MSEYWYIGSTPARSAMQKKRIEPRAATGMYLARVSSISFSAISASATAALISSEVTLETPSVSMSTVSSRMSPVALASR